MSNKETNDIWFKKFLKTLSDRIGNPNDKLREKKTFIPYSDDHKHQYNIKIKTFNLLPYDQEGFKENRDEATKTIYEPENSAFFKDVKIIINNNDTFLFKGGACANLHKKLEPKKMIENGILTFLQLKDNKNNNIINNHYCLTSEDENFLLVMDTSSIPDMKNKKWKRKYEGNILSGWKGPVDVINRKKGKPKYIKNLPIWRNINEEILFNNDAVPLLVAYCGGDNSGKDKIKIKCHIYAKTIYKLTDNDEIIYGDKSLKLKDVDEDNNNYYNQNSIQQTDILNLRSPFPFSSSCLYPSSPFSSPHHILPPFSPLPPFPLSPFSRSPVSPLLSSPSLAPINTSLLDIHPNDNFRSNIFLYDPDLISPKGIPCFDIGNDNIISPPLLKKRKLCETAGRQ